MPVKFIEATSKSLNVRNEKIMKIADAAITAMREAADGLTGNCETEILLTCMYLTTSRVAALPPEDVRHLANDHSLLRATNEMLACLGTLNAARVANMKMDS